MQLFWFSDLKAGIYVNVDSTLAVIPSAPAPAPAPARPYSQLTILSKGRAKLLDRAVAGYWVGGREVEGKAVRLK
jgi:hypothetical protein